MTERESGIIVPGGADRQADESWLRKQMTLPNIVMLVGISIGVGGYVKAFQGLEGRVQQLELRHSQDQRDAATTYQRRDVQDAILISINQRLGNIEADMKDIKSQRRFSAP